MIAGANQYQHSLIDFVILFGLLRVIVVILEIIIPCLKCSKLIRLKHGILYLKGIKLIIFWI
ncbi:hypothetical protein N7449_009607 [Penicillium cf. viridicatum]|uniref:Uncharacterized protein n=1 Tax=Penicillium cf. viridicatum TaxID=2972119 RepID=A0A9W9M8R0_9EURO|nr:hypothetical protein N7449_009607 [Penicillium cf. viridicatum]